MYGHPVRVLNDPLNSISTIYYQGVPVTNSNALPIHVAKISVPVMLDTGSNTIGAAYLNVNSAYVSNSNPMPVNLMNTRFTSKGELKTSSPEVLFFNTFQYTIETDTWDTSNINGGTAVFSSNISGVVMQVTNQLNSEVIRQTRNVMRYIPGRSAELTYAVRLTTPVIGIRRRFGLFNGDDGFYFEDNGGDYACVFINSNGNDNGTPYIERVSRNDWNGDKLDGYGESGVNADAEAQHIVTFEYEWYGAGQIIFKFIINGHCIIIHTFNTANRLHFPWSRTPFLPIRLELKNTIGATGTHKLYQGSNSLSNKGLTYKLGVSQSILSPLTGYNMSVANTFYPIISIRLKSTCLQGVVLPSYFQVGTLDNTNIFYKLLRNATVTNGTWVDVEDPNSFVQYNLTANNVITNGIQLDAGYVATGSGQRTELDKNTQYQLGRANLGTVSDTITLAVACVNANKNAVAVLTWVEQR